MEIYGYRRSYINTLLTWLAIFITGFLLRLIFFWRPHWMLYSTHRRCPLREAQKVLLIDKYNQCFVEKVKCLFGVPHPSLLLPKGRHLDEDEILICPDEIGRNGASNVSSYGSLGVSRQSSTVGSSFGGGRHGSTARRARQRTWSSRSNKSATTDCDDQSDDDDNKSDSPVEGDEMQSRDSQDKLLEFIGNGNNLDQEHIVEFAPEDKEDHKVSEIRFFENKKLRYVWHDDENNFIRLRGLDKDITLKQLQSMTKGLDRNEQRQRRSLFGENAIHIEIQPYMKILFQEVLGPFYIFQVFSCIIWFNDNYYYYGTCIIVMSVVSLVSGVIQIRRNQEQLRDTVESVDHVKVCRGADEYEEIESSQLVPGDIVVVPTFNSTLQFDGILINGNVIVNESMLTGESVPVTKTPIPTQNAGKNGRARNDIYYDEREHSKHTLFCGTKVLQTRYYGGAHVKALVVRVGFQTSKGELIRSIMFPKPVDFRFNRQIILFIGVLASVALIGFTYSVILKSTRGADLKSILISALDLITIVVPPALPAAMTVGIIYAQSRLKNNKIFCISPRSINISGCINCVCFDKTGTLTEDNLSFNEVVPLIEEKCRFGRPFDEDVMQTDSKKIERDHNLMLDNGDYSPLMICLAACHSLTIIDQKIIGDPLDLQMFEATGWVLEEPDVDDENKFDLLAPTVVRPPRRKRRTPPDQEFYLSSGDLPNSGSSTEDELDVVSVNANRRCQKDVGILRQFPFSSSLQRMSVITRQYSGSQYIVYSKGAPEKIASLCKPETIPKDFDQILYGYTRRGYRVLALAYRPLKAGLSYTRMQRASRTDIEKDLRFLGLLTLGNLLKEETIPVIRKLNKACIRSVMVTGDNMLTAISVANECNMILPCDRTILLEVEKSLPNEKSPNESKENVGDVNMTIGSKPESYPTTDMVVDPTTPPLDRSKQQGAAQQTLPKDPSPQIVEVIQLQTRAESDPILSPKRLKEPERPKLVWRYVDNGPRNDISGDDSSVNSAQVRLDMSEEARTHLALTGGTWDVIMKHYPELLNAICVRGTVFARMSPHQKQQLVEHLQSLQYYVAMCGDGANDSGALRAAHAGISLSDTEASVAAPFTSANANIVCVPTLISEGRAALVTAFGILKYMALYSLTQFCSVLSLYTMYTNFTDFEFLYEDLFIIAILISLFGRTEPYPTLDSKAPSSSLLSITQLTSVGLQIILVVFFQLLSLVTLWQYPWYEAHTQAYDHELAGHDNFAIFAMSAFQCISLAVVFSKGKPYRKAITSNKLLTWALIALTLATTTFIIMKPEWNVPYISLEVENVELEFRIIVLTLAATHFVVAMISERYIVDHLIFKKSDKFLEILGLRPKKALFERVDHKTRNAKWLSAISNENL